MAIITISRQFGTGGIELTKLLSSKLGYKFYAKEIIEEVAIKLGLETQFVAEYQEQFAHRSNWAITSFGGRLDFTSTKHISEKKYREVIEEIIKKFAVQDNVIILGSGGQCILRDSPRAFHFRVVADLATRVAHLREDYAKVPQSLPYIKGLEHRINNLDKQRRTFIRTHFGVNVENPNLYHAVFNLTRLGRERICQLMSEVVTGGK
jgi:cytidylate kinase